VAENTLYYGDNLDILPRYIKDETVDLICLDPPFKCNQDYNVLFAERNGSHSKAQIKALVGARPTEMEKGPDRGIDGRLYFHDDPQTRKTKQIIFSVKAGRFSVARVRDLRGVVERENAEFGVFISFK